MNVIVIHNNALIVSSFEHLLVPLLKAFWLGDFLVSWMHMEDVVVSLTRWTGPNVGRCETLTLCVEQVTNEDFMINVSSVLLWLEKVHRIEVSDVDTP